jgi:hypothetical protein
MKKTIDSVNLKITENVTQSVKNIDKLSKSIEKLKRVNGGGVGLTKTSSAISSFASSTSKSTAMLSKLTGMFKGASLLKLGITYMTAKKIGETIGGWVNYSKAAQENLNLFTVSMGENTQKFLEYADEVQAKLGIYKSDFLRNIGLYKKILDGFGVVEDRAVGMSQTLTELSYDISSFFNIPIDTAMEKVQSAMTGELRPLRELGYSFDVATLQQLAYKHGLDVTFDSLTQAEKVMLRYLAITEQSTDVMGDMARTIMTPANMFRILSQQVLQLKENLGNIFIPMLQTALPYIQAFTRLLTEAAQQLALMAGFKVTDIDYLTGIEMGKDDGGIVSDDDVDNARKIRKLLAPFDEINLLGSNDATSGYDDIQKLFEELTLPSHPGFMANLDDRVAELVINIKKSFSDLGIWVDENFGWIWDLIRPHFLTMQYWFELNMPKIQKFIEDTGKKVEELGKKWDELADKFKSKDLSAITITFGYLDHMYNVLKTVIDVVLSGLNMMIEGVNNAIQILKDLWGMIKSLFTLDFAGFAQNFINLGYSVADFVHNLILNVLNGVINIINLVTTSLNSLLILFNAITGKKWQIPQIPNVTELPEWMQPGAFNITGAVDTRTTTPTIPSLSAPTISPMSQQSAVDTVAIAEGVKEGVKEALQENPMLAKLEIDGVEMGRVVNTSLARQNIRTGGLLA